MANPELVYLNGDFVKWEDAKIHVFSPAVKFGAGVFEGIRAYWNETEEQLYVFRMTEHIDRLAYSQRAMRFEEIVEPGYAAEMTLETLRRNEFRESVHIRPTVYVDGFGNPGSTGPIGMYIVAKSLPSPEIVTKGCRAQVSAWQRISDRAMPARIKANANYNNSRFATIQAKTDGYDTAILLNDRGLVSEGPGMCLVIIRDGVAVTPSITNDILESITRDAVITLLREEMNIEVVERDVNRSELYAASEAFYCGTAWEVTPIVDIDGLKLGDGTPGSITRALQEKFFDTVHGRAADTRGWLTPVY